MKEKSSQNVWEMHFERAIHYYRNAREELRSMSLDDGHYANRKAVQRAAGVCWLAVIEAARGFFVKKGIPIGKIRSTDAYRAHLAEHKETNGKLFSQFEEALHVVHIAVYYNGVTNINVVKGGFETARHVIERLVGRKP